MFQQIHCNYFPNIINYYFISYGSAYNHLGIIKDGEISDFLANYKSYTAFTISLGTDSELSKEYYPNSEE